MIKLFKSTDNQYYFTICSKNGKTLVTSETYQEKRKAIDAIGKTIGYAMLSAQVYGVEVKEVNINDLTGE